MAAAHPLLEHERPGSHRVTAEVLAPFLGRRGRRHEPGALPEHAEQGRERLLQVERHGVLVDHLDRVDHRRQLLALPRADGLVQPLFHVPLDRLGVEVGAVVKLDALSQVEDDPLAVVLDVPAGRQLRIDGEIGAELGERVVDQIQDLLLGELNREHGVQGLGIGGEPDIERAAGLRAGRPGRRHRQDPGDRDAGYRRNQGSTGNHPHFRDLPS